MPNAHMVFVEDPEQKRRGEDKLLGWTLRMAYNHSDPL